MCSLHHRIIELGCNSLYVSLQCERAELRSGMEYVFIFDICIRILHSNTVFGCILIQMIIDRKQSILIRI